MSIDQMNAPSPISNAIPKMKPKRRHVSTPRLITDLREGDIIRVDFPGGPMRWYVVAVNKGDDDVSVRSVITDNLYRVNRDVLRNLMTDRRVRRETPQELVEGEIPRIIKES